FMDRMAAIQFNPEIPPLIQAVAGNLLSGAQNARELEARIRGATDAIAEMSREAAQNSLLNGTFATLAGNTAAALEKLRSMAPDIRSGRQKALDFYSANSGLDASGDLKKMLDH